MPEEAKQDTSSWKAVHLLATINRLSYSANTSKTRQELVFLMLNETIRVIQYQRATLWSYNGQFHLFAVSGTSQFDSRTESFAFLKKRLESIEKKDQLIVLEPIKSSPVPEDPSLLWLPIPVEGGEKWGLLLERWKKVEWLEDERVIIGFLMKNYGSALNRFSKKFDWKSLLHHKTKVVIGVSALFLLAMPIDLPISAPCEVIAKDPNMVAAPLEGIIHEILVHPGKLVEKGDVLFVYDKKELMHDQQTAEEEVGVLKAQLERAYILGMNDQEQLEQLTILKHRMNKAVSYLDLAKAKAKELEVLAPAKGIIVIDDPEKWRGNPVKIGEKVLTITDPEKSMIRMWIPEGDNVFINPSKEIKILLNITPEKTHLARLIYLSSEASLDDHSTPSFVGEADWVNPPQNQQLGLKGIATLYGPKVSVLYWLVRRPWFFIRSIIGS